MAKMYTLDKKLLTNAPVITIGENAYTVDNRTSTVKKLMKKLEKIDKSDEKLNADEFIIKAAFGKKADEIFEMDMPFEAQAELVNIAMSAMTGEEYSPSHDGEDDDARFQKGKEE